MALTRDEASLVGAVLTEEVDRLVDIWRGAEEALVLAARDPQLAALIGGGPQNLAAAEQRVRELIRDVERELLALREGTLAWAQPAVGREITRGSAVAIDSARRQGAQLVVGGALGVANVESLRLIVEDLIVDADFAASSASRQMRRHFRATQQVLVTEASLNQALLISEARLENAGRRTKRLAALFSERAGAGQLVNVNGRFFKLRSYARLIGNTRLAEAASTAAFQAVLAMGVDLVQISDHGPTDVICDQFAGKTFSISGRSSRFPSLQRRPPFHPNCKHILLPFISELKSERELKFAVARSAGRVKVGIGIEEFFQGAAA